MWLELFQKLGSWKQLGKEEPLHLEKRQERNSRQAWMIVSFMTGLWNSYVFKQYGIKEWKEHCKNTNQTIRLSMEGDQSFIWMALTEICTLVEKITGLTSMLYKYHKLSNDLNVVVEEQVNTLDQERANMSVLNIWHICN